MGNWFSRNKKLDEKVDEHIDENVLTPNLSDEIKLYIKKKVNNESNLSKKELEDALKELNNTKHNYEVLKKEYEILFQRSTEVHKVPSKISEKAIDDYVKAVFTAPSVVQQRGFITDAIEGAVYKKVLKAILCSVAHAVDSAQVQFIGHKLTFCIEPLGDAVARSISPEVQDGYIEQVNSLLEELYSKEEKESRDDSVDILVEKFCESENTLRSTSESIDYQCKDETCQCNPSPKREEKFMVGMRI